MGDERKGKGPDDTLRGRASGAEAGRPEIHDVGRIVGEPRRRAVARRAFLRESLIATVGLGGLSTLLAACGKKDGIPEGYEAWKSSTCMEEAVSSHRSGVSAVAFSPDGSRIASAGSDFKVKIWSASTAALLLTYSGHAAVVRDLAFSHDGTKIVSGGQDGAIQVWDAATGALVASCAHAGLMAVAFSPDGLAVASAGDTTVKTWNAATGAPILTYTGHANIVFDVTYSPDGGRIASCSSDGTVQIWGAATGLAAAAVTCAHANATSVDFSADGLWLVSGGTGSAQVWNGFSGQARLTIPGLATRAVFSPDGALVATAGWTTIQLWSAATAGAALLTITVAPSFGFAFGLAFSPDGARIASGDSLGMVKTWDAATGAVALACYDPAAATGADVDCDYRYASTGRCTCDTVCSCDQVCSCDLICTCNGQGPCTCHFVIVP